MNIHTTLNPTSHTIILITGERRAGKTTLCQRLVAALRPQGIRVSGMITHHVGPHDLEVQELASGQHYALTLPFIPEHDGALPRFRMDPQALARSSETLEQSFPTQVFLVDEIGPLELKHGQGWSHVPALLAQQRYAVACIVVRPELLGEAIALMPAPVCTVVNVTSQTRDRLPVLLRDAIREVCQCQTQPL